MIDLSHIPEIPGLRVFLPQGVDANSWQSWQKPRGFVMASIYAIGPGGGGGSAETGNTPAGGGGGGSGGVSRLTIPLFLLPDTLYIRVTPGGSGGFTELVPSDGVAGNTAFSPSSTLIGVYPSSTAQYLFLRANAGAGGGAGTAAAAGAGGAAGTISSTAEAPLGNLGATLFIAGNAGGSGGTSNPSGVSQGTGSQIYGGGGGGGYNGVSVGNGGAITGLANTPFLTSPGGSGSAQFASNGFSWSTVFPLKIYGGTGGQGRPSGAGGPGGAAAAWGAGGGGGGGGFTANKAGDGGPGCVIIQCW